MTTNIPIQYSNLARGLTSLKNPNSQGGTLLIEIPADIGKAYNGYKRGGAIEATEKLRKEGISALIWMFGIPIFNKLGNTLFEKIMKLPMDVDYDKDAKAITNVVKELYNKAPDTIAPEIQKYAKEGTKYIEKIKELNIEKSVKNIKSAKKIITLASWALNCILMGVVLPKINQKITANKLKKANEINKETKNRISMEQFQKQTQKTNKNIAFTGLFGFNGATDAIEAFVSGINTNNTVRLVSTDVPMIIGRCATARNKYEALEIGFMDSAAIFFYNFSLGLVEKLLGKISKTPQINSKVAELFTTKEGMNDLYDYITNKSNKNTITINPISQNLKDNIYAIATDGKYGKINRFVDKKDLNKIDQSITKLLEYLSGVPNIIKGDKIDEDILRSTIKELNLKNAGFYGIGVVISFLGLGWLIPKVAYFITHKITGKSGFVGIEGNEKK